MNEPATNYLIDTHCHIHDVEDFKKSPAEILQDAKNRGVLQSIVIGTSHEDSLRAQAFATKHQNVFWTYGIHPSEANGEGDGDFRGTIPEAFGNVNLSVSDLDISENGGRHENTSNLLVGIGEVGLDYHYPHDRDQQLKLLEEMLALAKDLNLPLVFHVREAFPDFFPIVDNQHITRAVVHSFSDNKKNLERCLDRGFYIGVNGLATFATLPTPPLERTLLETDAPYLTPVPNRGKINEPAYIADIAAWLSTKLGVSAEEIAEQTTKNARELFRLNRPELRPA